MSHEETVELTMTEWVNSIQRKYGGKVVTVPMDIKEALESLKGYTLISSHRKSDRTVFVFRR